MQSNFKRLLGAALIAGAAAGLAVTVVQIFTVIPLIDFAEFLEMGGEASAYVAPEDFAGVALEDPAKLFGTLAFNVLTGVAYALLTGAVMMLAGRHESWKTGLVWGLGGFCAFALAPAISMPPEPPGAHFTDLADRQLWWWWAALGAAAGLSLAALARHWGWKVLGLGLIALPHVFGAPVDPDAPHLGPRGLELDFALASLVSTAVFWLVLGALQGQMMGRTEPE